MTLSWRVQNFVVVGRIHFKLEHCKFWSNFEFDRNIVSGTGAWWLNLEGNRCFFLYMNYQLLELLPLQLLFCLLFFTIFFCSCFCAFFCVFFPPKSSASACMHGGCNGRYNFVAYPVVSCVLNVICIATTYNCRPVCSTGHILQSPRLELAQPFQFFPTRAWLLQFRWCHWSDMRTILSNPDRLVVSVSCLAFF